MIAPVDTELSSRVGVFSLLDVLHMRSIYPYGDVMFGLTGYGTSMTANASLIVNHESVVRHYCRDEVSAQNGSVSI